jgi:dephospho-CoA kinase
MSRPLILGLTGSIGMGKSTVAAMFAENGVPVFDADAEVRRMQGPDGALLPAIEEAFPGLTGPEGVKRQELSALVFHDADALARLEAIVHPAVREARAQFLADHTDATLVLYDIPLLFEKTNVDDVDKIVVVSAPAGLQRERVLARPDMTPEKLDSILAQQMPDAEKRARADFVIDTGCSLEETAHSVAELVRNLTS